MWHVISGLDFIKGPMDGFIVMGSENLDTSIHRQDMDHKATRPRSYSVTWKSGLYSRAGCFADLGFSTGL